MLNSMMHDPWFYVVLTAVLVLVTVGPLFAIRLIARTEKRRGNPERDAHLG